MLRLVSSQELQGPSITVEYLRLTSDTSDKYYKLAIVVFLGYGASELGRTDFPPFLANLKEVEKEVFDLYCCFTRRDEDILNNDYFDYCLYQVSQPNVSMRIARYLRGDEQ